MDLQIRDRLGPGISLEDLEVVCDAVILRFDAAEAETERVERMREVLWAASVLTRALSTHMQHSLVDCCGTLGSSDLPADTLALHRALVRYSQLVRSAAADYRPAVRPSEQVRAPHNDRTAAPDPRGRRVVDRSTPGASREFSPESSITTAPAKCR